MAVPQTNLTAVTSPESQPMGVEQHERCCCIKKSLVVKMWNKICDTIVSAHSRQKIVSMLRS